MRLYGCYVGRDRRTLPTNLQIAVEEEEYHKWTKEEIDQQLRDGGESYSWWNPANRKSQAPKSVASTPRTTPATPRAATPRAATPRAATPRAATPAAEEQHQRDIPQDQHTYPPLPPSQPDTPVSQNLPTPHNPPASINRSRLPSRYKCPQV